MREVAIIYFFLMITSVGWCQKHSPFTLVSFNELGTVTSDTLQLKAYVLDVYVCPPCPPGAMCKPCIENHCTIVEEKPIDIMKVRLEDRVRIFADHPEKLEVGKQYLFTVRFKIRTENSKDNLVLISYKEF
ncbi:MAG TPA: hypothetical protein DGG95_12015 [Cytophagales bacterium]|jgi:hypothetical protein|nr:hypothetical protein [Cytophagales bacterium]